MAAPGQTPTFNFDFFICCADADRVAAEALHSALLARTPGRSYHWIPPAATGPSVERSLEALLRSSRLIIALVTPNTEPHWFDNYEIRRAAELAEAGTGRFVAVTIDIEEIQRQMLDELKVSDRLDARALGSTRSVADHLCALAGVSLPERKPPSVELVDELERLLQYRERHQKRETRVAGVVPRIDQLAQEIAVGAEATEGDIVAGAKLLRPLGSDSFSYTWFARRESTGEECITKMFRLERLTHGMMLWGFRQAVRALALLNDQPHTPRSIVRLLEVSPDTLAFTTEYLPEGTLEQVGQRAWSIEKRVELFTQVCAAVGFAHDLGIVHGDIKPSSILLNADGRAVLTDFALSAPQLIPESSKSWAAVAAPMYMAPELRTEEATESSDIYSLGRLLYYLLIERTPGPQVEAEPTLDALTRFPPSLVGIVRRSTRLDPAQRYVSVKEMLADLEVHRTGAAVPAVLAKLRLPARSVPLWRNPVVLSVSFAMMALALATFAVVRKPPASAPFTYSQPNAPGGAADPAAAATTAPSAAHSATPDGTGECKPMPLACGLREMKDDHGMEFVHVCSGILCMGSADGEADGKPDERPLHTVNVPELWMGKYEVSNGEYRQVVKDWKGDARLPATNLTWDEADQYCKAVGHRLPSEAEWEYAARGSDGRHFPWGDSIPSPGRAAFGRAHGGADSGPSPVDAFSEGSGPFGTFQQAGNVAEWVADCFDAKMYKTRKAEHLTDAKAIEWPNCPTRVIRGGSFLDPSRSLRAASRNDSLSIMKTDAIGFRCAR